MKVRVEKVFQVELLVSALLSLVNLGIEFTWFRVGISIIAFLSILINFKKFIFYHIWNVVVINVLFSFTFESFLKLIAHFLPDYHWELFILDLLLLPIILLPLIFVSFTKMKNMWWRFITLVWLNPWIRSGYMVNNNEVSMLIYYLFFAGLYTGIVWYLFKEWRYYFGFHFKVKNLNLTYWLGAFLLLATTITIVIFEVSIHQANYWNEIFNLNLDYIDLSMPMASYSSYIKDTFSAFGGVLIEEVVRYLSLFTFLIFFKNNKHKLLFSIIASMIIFSLAHYSWIFDSEVRYRIIVIVLNTIDFGCYMALIYLYTGKLWLVWLIHMAFDWLVSSGTPLAQGMLLSDNSNGYIYLMIKWLVALIILIIFLKVPAFSSRLNDTANRMVKRR
ncbi:CPBP family intramembrane glutamic endopeptidase [Lactobacillus psittaci]|nr:CPBP family intramembrane glutamic endopeptidase [Lactobacillus psittaci]